MFKPMFKPYQAGGGRNGTPSWSPQQVQSLPSFSEARPGGAVGVANQIGGMASPRTPRDNPTPFNFAEAERGMQIQQPNRQMGGVMQQAYQMGFGDRMPKSPNSMVGRSTWGGGGNDLISQGMRQLQGMSPQQVQSLVSALAPDIQTAVIGGMGGQNGRFLKRR